MDKEKSKIFFFNYFLSCKSLKLKELRRGAGPHLITRLLLGTYEGLLTVFAESEGIVALVAPVH
jgi:hypothetical protein